MEKPQGKGNSFIWKVFLIFQILAWANAIFDSFRYSSIYENSISTTDLVVNSIATILMPIFIYYTASRALKFKIAPFLDKKEISFSFILFILFFISYQSWMPVFNQETDQLQAELKSFYYVLFLFSSICVMLENSFSFFKEKTMLIWSALSLFYLSFTGFLSFIFLPDFVQFAHPSINVYLNVALIIVLCFFIFHLKHISLLFFSILILSFISQELKIFLDFHRGGYDYGSMIHIFIVYNSPFFFITLYFYKRNFSCLCRPTS